MRRKDAGFTLVEMLIAMAVMLLILGGVFQAFNPATGSFRTQPEVADLQQRLRVGNERLYSGLVVAGAGIYSGQALGTLGQFFAPVLPYLVGALHNDPAAGVYFRTDAITIFHVPTTASQCTIRDRMPQPSSEVKVNAEPGCPANDPLCGFDVGMRVIIFDGSSFDFFTITEVQSDALHLQHRPPINPADFSKAYDVGAVISQVNTDAYYWRQDPATNTFQLMHYDLFQNDVPLIDDVVNLRFEYMGDAAPPVLRAPVTDPIGPWTTYGPKPPALGVDVASDNWPAGENCTFTVDPASGLHVSRLASLGAPGTLTALDATQLSDGPWCPDEDSINRYDADLHRVRQIRVTFRVQTGVANLRGPAGVLFNRAGTGRLSDRLVPDQAVQFDVTPRNLNLGR
jgi:prepilin-type N-terminal cleavage/methylation domain-containing protein